MQQKANNWSFYLKKLNLLLKYYLRSITKRTISFLPFFFFLISFFILLIIIIPSLGHRLRQSKLLSHRPYNLKVVGQVIQEKKSNKQIIHLPLTGAVIEIGGFKTQSKLDGSFELQFSSHNLDSIPLILSYNQNEIIYRLKFSTGEFEKVKKIILK